VWLLLRLKPFPRVEDLAQPFPKVEDLGLYWNAVDQRLVFGALDLRGPKRKTIVGLVLEQNLVDIVRARINVYRLHIRA
jgi:hypothetical protein